MEEKLNKLMEELKQFLDVYKVLTPEGKAAFEAQMGPVLKNADPTAKIAYESMLSSAKEGLSLEEAFERLKNLSIKKGEADKTGQDNGKT